MTDEDALRLIPHVELFVEQVTERDADAMLAVIAAVRKVFSFDGHGDALLAITVMLTEMFTALQDRYDEMGRELAVTVADRDRFAEQYLDHRDRVRELRALLNAKAAASTAKQVRKAA